MIAHVICDNDAIMAVVLDDEERAKGVMERLAREDWERNPWDSWGGSRRMTFDTYKKRHYWHLHSVEVL